jgi:hypothetical protein
MQELLSCFLQIVLLLLLLFLLLLFIACLISIEHLTCGSGGRSDNQFKRQAASIHIFQIAISSALLSLIVHR